MAEPYAAGDNDDEEELALVMPFVVCATQGGPYDDESFVAGWALGALDQKLEPRRIDVLDETFRTESIPQVDLIAMRHGYALKHRPADGFDGWSYVELRRVYE